MIITAHALCNETDLLSFLSRDATPTPNEDGIRVGSGVACKPDLIDIHAKSNCCDHIQGMLQRMDKLTSRNKDRAASTLQYEEPNRITLCAQVRNPG